MAVRESARVCWIFASEDEPIARELLARAAVLEALGLVHNSVLIGAGLAPLETLHGADVFMLLCSDALMEGPAWRQVLAFAVQNPSSRMIPVVLSTTALPSELDAMQMLPRDGKPIKARRNREEALLEVIHGLFETVQFRASAGHRRRTRNGRNAFSTGARSTAPMPQEVKPATVESFT